jgi:hypothetical protein
MATQEMMDRLFEQERFDMSLRLSQSLSIFGPEAWRIDYLRNIGALRSALRNLAKEFVYRNSFYIGIIISCRKV